MQIISFIRNPNYSDKLAWLVKSIKKRSHAGWIVMVEFQKAD